MATATTETGLDWPKIRNALRKRLRAAQARGELRADSIDDALQDACGILLVGIDQGCPIALAIHIAARDAARGCTIAYSPAPRAAWEELADSRYSPRGVSEYSRRAARGR